MTHPLKNDRTVPWLLVAYAVYAGFFIFRTSFVIDGVRYFSLFDDAMISMRYARNLADGFGVVWNPGGERVAGYTNPLWVVYMSILHLLPVAESMVSLFVQGTAAILLMINLVYVAKIADFVCPSRSFVRNCAVLLTASFFPLNNWALQGMEVSVLTLLITVALWDVLRSLRSGEFSRRWSLVLGVAILFRLDAAVPLLGCLTFVAIADPGHRSRTLRWGLGSLLFFLSLQLVGNLVYYGDLLPNTYYLKMTGIPVILRFSKGVVTLIEFIWRMNPILFATPFVFAALRRDKESLLLAWAILGQLAYSVYVGGDVWEHRGGVNRYVSIVMPAFMILFSWALSTMVQWIGAALPAPPRTALLSRMTTLLAAFSLVSFNAINGPWSFTEWLLIKPPMHAADNQMMVQQARLVQEVSTPQATIAVVWAGAIPYFADRYAIDLLGKNDRFIARGEMRFSGATSRFTAFLPGHMKWDYDHSITQLQPDLILQTWEPTTAVPYLGPYVVVRIGPHTWWLRKQSPNIRWDRVDALRTD